jgi:hypothetical protein
MRYCSNIQILTNGQIVANTQPADGFFISEREKVNLLIFVKDAVCSLAVEICIHYLNCLILFLKT